MREVVRRQIIEKMGNQAMEQVETDVKQKLESYQ
jgi:hypothetical protein